MTIWRVLMLLFSEYGVILLSGLASVLAYVLNISLEDASATRWPRLRAFLKKLVKYREKKQAKSSFFKNLIFPLTLLTAVALMPFIRLIVVNVEAGWNELIDKYPTRVAKGIALLCLAILAFALFLARKYRRGFYAFLEIAVGLTMAWDALGFVDVTSGAPSPKPLDLNAMTGKLFSSDGLKVLAALYVIIRGLANWDERPERNGQVKEKTL